MVKVLHQALPRDTEKDKKAQDILSKLHHGSEEARASVLAKQVRLPYVDLHIFPIEPADLRTIPEADSRKLNVVIFQRKGREFHAATTTPQSLDTLDYIKSIESANGWKGKVYVASQDSLERAWSQYNKKLLIDQLDFFKVSLSGADLEKFEKDFGDLINLKHRITEIPTTEVIQIILAGAVKLNSSDIHFETQGAEIRLRYRIDGVLQDVGQLPASIYAFIVSRIKMLGKMKLNVRDRSQDGHFSIDLSEKRIDIRINIIPSNHGENINMRLLDQSGALLTVESLGLRGLANEVVQKSIAKPDGLILNTGPTGSGKTTTLYALLNTLNGTGNKIITIEDPVEYEIKGIVQTQVSKDKAYTFANGLRSIVRQDPDIILVGEIRDEETASIAVDAALTGHLVLSTLHTNNAAGSIPRMIEMGIKPTVLAPASNIFVGQRLVRKLCDHCKTPYEPAEETIDSLKEILSLISPKAQVEIPKDITALYQTVGCKHCNFTGYNGRIGIFEVLEVTQAIVKLILAPGTTEVDIMKTALEDGMITMTQDGILKAIEGITSFEEVLRVTGENDFLKEIYKTLMDQTLSRSFLITAIATEKTKQQTASFEQLGTFLKQTNQKEILRYLFASAILLKANDIHIEPIEGEVFIRLRIDGILQTIVQLPINEYASLLGEIKLLSGLKTEVRAGVKDSRFSVLTETGDAENTKTKVDVRVSIILGGFGETVVMRLLNQGALALEVDHLDIRKENLDILLNGIRRSNGLILNTGPTGSGKTTTLYSLLKQLNKPDVKIITVEDPIEYQMSGILQTQVDESSDYGFATSIRALMRQNPDIIMIGEIRDEETAKAAVQASLTGHLVLATLHTNNAAGAIPRLINMQVSADDIINAGGLFMAQRLVRRLCSCKEKHPLDGQEKEIIQRVLSSLSPKSGLAIPPVEFHYHPKGCELCNGTGFKGRVTLSEILVLNKEIQLLIASGALAIQIQEKAVEEGMITMSQDGMLRVLSGDTSLGEVLRVVEE
ncbi:MAG: GspE/PulE family protein [Candidatus Moranbacteria bacterium]|nr:GspE/PulE family protein [Candidatus Moranbacteria bacterium]